MTLILIFTHLNLRLDEMYTHAKYQVAISDSSKVMVNVKVGCKQSHQQTEQKQYVKPTLTVFFNACDVLQAVRKTIT